MALDPDPWNWSVQDVKKYFQHEAQNTIRDNLPHGKLPLSDSFTAVLVENEVSGATLLTAVDSSFLREDCGLKALGMRSSVIFCIQALQARSARYQRRNVPADAEKSLSAANDQPSEATVSSEALPTAAIGENTRAGETQIEDERGRKRRRLDLSGSALATEPVKEQSPGHDQTADRFLPPTKMAANEVFFGKTTLGREVELLPPSQPGFFDEDHNDMESANFQFHRDAFHQGVDSYVGTQIRHFMTATEEFTTKRHSREALVRYPYRSTLRIRSAVSKHRSAVLRLQHLKRGRIFLEDERSALVVSAARIDSLEAQQGNAPLVATRESEMAIETGAFRVGYTSEQAEGLQGEYSYLLDKYPAGPESEESKDASSEVASDLANLFDPSDAESQIGEDEAEVEDDDDEMGPEEVETIIEEVIARHKSAWLETELPKLESKQAWTIWKKMKKSKSLRDVLTKQAQSTAAKLEARLGRMCSDLAALTWDSRQALLTQCQVLEVTVADREKELWKISVWQRTQEPEHDARPAASRHAPRSGRHPSPSGQPDLQRALNAMGSDDRISLSPIPGDVQSLHVPSNDDAAGERYFTPEGSPPPAPRSSGSSFVVSDAEDADQSEDAGLSADDQTPSKTRRTSTNMPFTPNSNNLKREAASQAQPTLPSLPSSHSRAQPPPIVDLTGLSSSTPEKPTKKPRKKRTKAEIQAAKVAKAADTSGNPEEASAEIVDAWDYQTLSDNADRRRILIKLVMDSGSAMRDLMHASFQSLLMARFCEQLSYALRRLQGDEPGSRNLDPSRAKSFLHCARIACSWYLCRPDPMQAENLGQLDDVPAKDVRTFVAQLRPLLQKREKMFQNKPATSYSAPHVLSSTDERDVAGHHDSDGDLSDIDTPVRGSGKKRKAFKISQAAADSRKAGHARMQRFLDVQSQSSNPTQLQAMIPSDPSHSSIEVNIARDEGMEPIFVHPEIAKKIKPHQIEGVQFLWREIAGEMGCLLSHVMGLGKTMQAITLLVAINEASQSSNPAVFSQLPKRLQLGQQRTKRQLRFLVLCPPMLLANWRREIELWSPAKTFENVRAITSTKDKPGEPSFASTLRDWSRKGGILCVGYSIFRLLIERKQDTTDSNPDLFAAVDRILLDETDLVVADEAHGFKNARSSLSKAVQRIQTVSRVALTGTPLSNSVDEVYSMINWVSPGYLGDPSEFNGRFGTDIREGLYADSTYYQRRQGLKRLQVLIKEIGPKVHRADVTALKGVLKPKTEFIITVELTQRQKQAYAKCVESLVGDGRNAEASQVAIFAWLSLLKLLNNHPRCYKAKLLTPVPPAAKKKGKQDLELPEDVAVSGGGISPRSAEEEVADVSVDEQDLYSLGFTKPIIDALVEDLGDDLDVNLSVKSCLLGRILQLSKNARERVLVFTTSIPTLDYLSDLLKSQRVAFARIDGSTTMQARVAIVASFQDNKYDVLLLSTKAAGTGLNLQAANRVIILDSLFNPTWEEQAIGRAYRFGQKKPVYVYRFVTGGTFEDNLYNKQLFKTSLASRVVDKKNPQRNAMRNTIDWLYKPKPVKEEDLMQWKGKDPLVLDKIIDAQSRRTERDESLAIMAIKTMEVLQAEEAETLTAEEQLEVEQELLFNKNNRRGRIKDPMVANGLAPLPSTAPVFSAAASAASGSRPSPTMSRLQRPVIVEPAGPARGDEPRMDSNLPARDIRNQHQMGGGARGSATQVPRGQDEQQPRYLGGLPVVRRD